MIDISFSTLCSSSVSLTFSKILTATGFDGRAREPGLQQLMS